jgi:2'-5' RNA ligase
MFAVGTHWKSWMTDYQFGTLVYVPKSDLRQTVDRLRTEYDSASASTSMAHITLTQPLAKAPSSEDIRMIQEIINSTSSFEMTIGPFTTSPNKKLIWLDITPKKNILNLRERLHDTGLLRTDLPLTKGFIPHMTISEMGREPDEVTAINTKLNAQMNPWTTLFDSVAWIIPNEEFVFQEHQVFELR